MPLIDEFRLTDRIALVAGDKAGFLAVLAEVLAEAGAGVRITAATPGVVEEAVAAAKRWDPGAKGIVADLGTQEGVDGVLHQLAGTQGQVDILVNSFRTEYARPMSEVPPEEWDGLFYRNVRPVFLICKAIGRAMVAQERGRIINVISGLAERGMINSAASCATQGAVLQLTRALALEWGRHNVRVNVVGTGWFSSEEEPPEEAQRELLVRYIPLRRRGHPRDIAPLLAYLASDACDYTTGQPIYIDGGLMAHP